MVPRRVKCFLSSADADSRIVRPLWSLLEPRMAQSGTVAFSTFRYDVDLVAGEKFEERMIAALDESDLCLYAVTATFLSRQFIIDHELPAFLTSRPGKHPFPALVGRLPQSARRHGLEDRQMFGYKRPFASLRRTDEKEQWANDLVDELHTVIERYDLGT